jgi:hypothetical protein
LTATKATAGDVATFTNAAASNKTGFIYTDNRFVGLFTTAGGGGSGFAVDTSIPSVYIQVGGAAIATATAAGFAVTGTLSATTTGKVGTTLGVGNATPSGSGSGITFPATQSASTDANTLDDYEEGTWTPTQGAGLTVVGTFSATGRYTKIGRQVLLEGKLSATTSISASGSGQALCENIPFSALGSGQIGGPGSTTNANVTAVGAAYVQSTTVANIIAISATADIFFSVSYVVA